MMIRSKCLAVFLGIVLAAAQTASGADDGSRLLRRLKPGMLVHVMLKTAPGFDAVFIARDGDRVLFELMHPDEAIAVPVDAVLEVGSVRSGQTDGGPAGWGVLGGIAGFFGSLLLIRVSVFH